MIINVDSSRLIVRSLESFGEHQAHPSRKTCRDGPQLDPRDFTNRCAGKLSAVLRASRHFAVRTELQVHLQPLLCAFTAFEAPWWLHPAEQTRLVPVADNEPFWRQVFLGTWDDPRRSALSKHQDPLNISDSNDRSSWRRAVIKADSAIRATAAHRPAEHDISTLLLLLRLSQPNAHSQSLRCLSLLLDDQQANDAVCMPKRFEALHGLHGVVPVPNDLHLLTTSQVSAELSSLWNTCDRRWCRNARNAARSRTYDLSKLSVETHYGPFTYERLPSRRGQHANWIQIEAIMRTIVPNVWEYMRDEGFMDDTECLSIFPLDASAARPYTATPPNDPRDWAGVEGTWRRVVCFLDYRDLFAFNIRRLHGQNPLVEPVEAVRLLTAEIHLESVGDLDDPPDTPFPTLHFSGTSTGGAPNEARCRGTVSMMKDGNVRWSYISSYDGEDRWSTSAVQIGGIQSKRGVMGLWSGTEHAFEDPAGPIWWFKKSKHDSIEDL